MPASTSRTSNTDSQASSPRDRSTATVLSASRPNDTELMDLGEFLESFYEHDSTEEEAKKAEKRNTREAQTKYVKKWRDNVGTGRRQRASGGGMEEVGEKESGRGKEKGITPGSKASEKKKPTPASKASSKKQPTPATGSSKSKTKSKTTPATAGPSSKTKTKDKTTPGSQASPPDSHQPTRAPRPQQRPPQPPIDLIALPPSLKPQPAIPATASPTPYTAPTLTDADLAAEYALAVRDELAAHASLYSGMTSEGRAAYFRTLRPFFFQRTRALHAEFEALSKGQPPYPRAAEAYKNRVMPELLRLGPGCSCYSGGCRTKSCGCCAKGVFCSEICHRGGKGQGVCANCWEN